LESVFTEAAVQALATPGGALAARLYDFRSGGAALATLIEVTGPDDLEALRKGLGRAARPLVVPNVTDGALCPLLLEVEVSTSRGEIRFWVCDTGFSVVPRAVFGKCFFSQPLAEALVTLLRKNGHPGLHAITLDSLSGVRD
jgi:hypothetical protein